MFSSRTNWSLSKNQLILLLEDLKAKGPDIIDLTESNPTTCQIQFPQEAILDSLTPKQNLIYEPSWQGKLSPREAICQYYHNNGVFLSPEQIFLTASTSEAYGFVFRLLTNPGDHILAPRPSYPLFEFLSQLNDVVLDYYDLFYTEGWSINVDHLLESITPKTKVIVLVNPNNPTGSYVKKEELTRIVDICREKGLALLCDEVFGDYRFTESESIVQSCAANSSVLTFALSGASKMFGLPQMKIGWAVASGPQDQLAGAMARMEVICDTYLSVNAPAMNALSKWFSLRGVIQKEIMNRLRENKEFLENSVQGTNCEVLKAEGGWYVVMKIPPVKSEEAWCLDILKKAHVFVHPGYFFDFDQEAYLVLSLLGNPESFQKGVMRILEVVGKSA